MALSLLLLFPVAIPLLQASSLRMASSSLLKVSQGQSRFVMIIIHDIIIDSIMVPKSYSCNKVISIHDGITVVIMRLNS